ncbi:cupin domain-containing protein [Cyanobium sp. ATX 6A2]|uniref:cupin domain-containing protein n=1 Tax=Cyanobium sp. ATX 6A2 TaxID=2823700 RepID=UPI0020CBFEEB|nr:cupin domain-containing protein [Cyanobium sp. ATX 6A2]MCP9888612.1 cupin domain-containing protein [Cyanobium sp. ATX 6A2]
MRAPQLQLPPPDPDHLIRALELLPHPEGGHYRETYRASAQVQTPRGPRAASTAILFLLAAGECSLWHRIHSDEAWHHHGGGGLLVYELCPAGSVRRTRLGLNLAAGERPQHVVPAGSWFAAEPAPASSWGLVSCTVAPGFDFNDFELARTDWLEPHGAALASLCPQWRRLCQDRPAGP